MQKTKKAKRVSTGLFKESTNLFYIKSAQSINENDLGIISMLCGGYALSFGETYIKDHKILSKHNLFYDFVEAAEANDKIVDMKRIILQDNQILRSNK